MEFEINLEMIKQKLESLKNLGFTEIHLPGGTSKDGSCASSVVISKFYEKQLFFVGVPYNPTVRTSNNNKQFGETPEEVAIREAMEETGLVFTKEDLHLLIDYFVDDNRISRRGEKHHKYFFIVEKFTGSLWKIDGANPISKETGEPMMLPAQLFQEVIFKGHFNVVQKAFDYLVEDHDRKAIDDKNYAMALVDLSKFL